MFVNWSWHGISLGDLRNDLVEMSVTAHVGDVSDDLRGDINVSQSPADSCCTLAVLLVPSSCLEMHPRRPGKLAKKAPMQAQRSATRLSKIL